MTKAMPPSPCAIYPSEHPCYSETAHMRYARLHLAVAPLCNIVCAYCDRRVGDSADIYRPGVAERILSPAEVPELVRRTLLREPRLRVIGVAGPGEPLANPETFEALALARETWTQVVRERREPRKGEADEDGPGPEIPDEPILCLSTNGLLLDEKVSELARLGVRTVSVTVNAVSPAVGSQIYLAVRQKTAGDERTLSGEAGAAFLARRQLAGIRRAVAAGLTVKVNTVLIPGVNLPVLPTPEARPSEVGLIAQAVARAGASLHNVVPLIPLGAMSDRPRPSADELRRAQGEAAGYLPQFHLCRQCRADAVGVPGREPGRDAGTKRGRSA